jgi:acyl carrier protein
MDDQARALIKQNLDFPGLLDQVADDDDLISAGVNSGELIRIAAGCEQQLSRALTDDELAGLSSVHAVAALLGIG